ncbi:aminotransferase class I/II-fold pyridoxal phosphate-dependent enzyme [Virgisporangium aliadipatigenens]|uniref:aminotransferase class I/II-fold pyridoxal phosphate-dependent enzyme n=1 Tax=Virgisporangium aliadipatigenens TaxID=741659 RepID=UPI0019425168|nr:aminotransferase class I/II-fold pyridoxal phosphate-dependent enzyme [Virgisporangium aliadipatigenens]
MVRTVAIETLGVRDVGGDDDLQRLGLDSLIATILAVSLQEELGIHVPLAVVLEHPVVDDLVRVIQDGDDRAPTSTEVRLDYNESPIGPPPRAVAELRERAGDLHRYPRDLEPEVTREVAAHFGVDPGDVLLTNGVDEAVDLLLHDVAEIWTVAPGFDGYAQRAAVHDRAVHTIPLDDRWQPVAPPLAFAGSRAVFLAQPNNPTGNLFPRAWVEEVTAVADLVFLDETYLEFSDSPSFAPLLRSRPNLVLFKSFSKAFGLAGARLGALVGATQRIAPLRERRAFYSVDSLSLASVAGALADADHRAELKRHMAGARTAYLDALRSSEVFAEVRDTQTNFLLARCPTPQHSAAVTDRLAQQGVRVRRCADFGLPQWIRVSIGSYEALDALSNALARLRLP